MSSPVRQRQGLRRSGRTTQRHEPAADIEGLDVAVVATSRARKRAAGSKDEQQHQPPNDDGVHELKQTGRAARAAKADEAPEKAADGAAGNGDAGGGSGDTGGVTLEAAPDAEKGAPPAKRTRGRPPTKRAAATGTAAAGKPSGPTRDMELQLMAQGYKAVGGADEAGRGPLAGPVVAAVVVLPPPSDPTWRLPAGLNDSKAISEEEREAVYEALTTDPRVKWAVSVIDHREIDRINILQAALGAMRQSACQLLEQAGTAGAPTTTGGADPCSAAAAAAGPSSGAPDAGARTALDFLLVDGNRMPKNLPVPARTVVKGDATCCCIAAASCIAKVTRDRLMMQLDQQYPQYGFAQHKGYGVPAHMQAIRTHGPSAVHRRSFEPVKSMTGWSREAMLLELQEKEQGNAQHEKQENTQDKEQGKAQRKGKAKRQGQQQEEDGEEAGPQEHDQSDEGVEQKQQGGAKGSRTRAQAAKGGRQGEAKTVVADEGLQGGEDAMVVQEEAAVVEEEGQDGGATEGRARRGGKKGRAAAVVQVEAVATVAAAAASKGGAAACTAAASGAGSRGGKRSRKAV